MKNSELNRRDFTRWTAAAFGGVVAGSIAGCGSEPATDSAAPADSEAPAEAPPGSRTTEPPAGSGTTSTAEPGSHDVAFLMEEPHVCRGLNTCKGKEAAAHGADNACKGQGECATAVAHECHTNNECKGQGGCGEHPGQNACKGQGECSVPLSQGTWEKARAAFEKAMTATGEEVGAAPAKPA